MDKVPIAKRPISNKILHYYIKKGNYIRVDTTTGDKNDNRDNNSASPTLLAAKGKCKSTTTQTTCFNNLRGNQLPAALKEAHVSVNKYINPLNFEAYETNCII